MSNDHTDKQSSKKPENPVSNRGKIAPVINLAVNTGLNQHKVDIKNDPKTNQITINVIDYPNDDIHQAKANVIAAAANGISSKAFWINVCLFVGTLILAGISLNQALSAGSAAKTAEQTLKEIKSFDNTTLAKQEAAIKSADIATAKKESRDSAVFAYQKSEFDAQTKPYLQVNIDSVRLLTGLVIIYYTLNNLTNNPVKIIGIKGSFPFAHSEKAPKPISITAMATKPFNKLYVIKGSPQLRYAYGFRPYSEPTIHNIVYGIEKLYMQEVFIYQNLINNKKREYRFYVRITYTDDKERHPYLITKTPSTEFLFNENYDLK